MNTPVNRIIRVFTVVACLLGLQASAQGTAVVTGRVIDAATKSPVADVVVTATSPALLGEQIVITDTTGTYRVPNLPPGTYTLRLEKEAYRPYARSDVTLRSDTTIRVNVELLPEALRGEEIVVVGRAPTIDVASSSTGVNVSSDFMNNIPVLRPGGRNSATRSFESLAEIAPGAHADEYGISIAGTTSPENHYIIDGLTVNDPGFGILGTPLTLEFVREVNVVTGGYMPEHGRATGGIVNVVTKSGSNEFHGSLWGNWAPGFLSGRARDLTGESTLVNDINLHHAGDVGVELGGPVMKDRLWFYVGFAPAIQRDSVTRRVLRRIPCSAEDFQSRSFGCNDDPDSGQYFRVDPVTGFSQREEVEDARERYFADIRTYQYIGKLTYLINADHNVTLSVLGAPATSGGPGRFGFDEQSAAVELARTTAGDLSALQHRYVANPNDVALKYSGAFLEKRALVDLTVGWHHQDSARLPTDGSAIGSASGEAGRFSTAFRRSPPHNLTRFRPEMEERCTATVTAADGSEQPVDLCPVPTYRQGGPGFLQESILDRYQARLVGTYFLEALGHHTFKAGLDLEYLKYESDKAYSGAVLYRESLGGGRFDTTRMYGYMEEPNVAVIQRVQTARSTSNTVGGFLQDSWQVLDLFTVNAGIRYDVQSIYGDDGRLGMRLPNQWSPRLGVIYDFTQQGRSKVFANYARYYENVPLGLADRAFPGERSLFTGYAAPTYDDAGNIVTPGCNPSEETDATSGECQVFDAETGRTVRNPNQVPFGQAFFGDTNADLDYYVIGGDAVAVDPDIKPQSSDELVFGAEYEVLPSARAGVTYTRRYMNYVIEDLSRDEASTYFLGNPGYGVPYEFPKAVRNYDALTVYFNKTWSDLWLAQVSYTWSRLHGNYAGLFRPETGQLDPNINADFDLVSLLANRTGPLPFDRTHSIKAFGGREIVLTGAMSLNLGLTYRGRSGVPINYFGSHFLYGSDEVFVLPRGAGGRMPWQHEIDGHLGYTYRLSKDNAVTVSVDIFNLLNFQAASTVDERYTAADVVPVRDPSSPDNDENLRRLEYPDGTPFDPADVHPTYKNVTSYQPPRVIRLGAKVTF